MPSNVTPLPLVQRYEPCLPLAQDVLSDLEAFQCAARNQRAAPYAYQGEPRNADPPGWDPAAVQPSRFAEPAQLAALGCGYMLNFPFSHPERVRYFDRTRCTEIGPLFLPRLRPENPTVLVWELVRVPALRWGLALLETIAVYVRGTLVNNLGIELPGAEVVFGGPVGQFFLGGGVGPAAPGPQVPDPCPFPFVLQGGVNGGFSSPEITIRFRLINYQHSREVRDEPPYMVAGRTTDVPPEDITPPWEDMRYQWGARYTERHKWIVGGHSLIRLFALVSIRQPTGLPPTLYGWKLKMAGRLAGYNQAAGPYAAAQRSALWRI